MEFMKIFSILYLFFQISSFNVSIVDGTETPISQSAAAAEGTSNDTTHGNGKKIRAWGQIHAQIKWIN
jgi:hypothetical protein